MLKDPSSLNSKLLMKHTPSWMGRGLSKLAISRVIIRVTPFRALIALLITYLLGPLPLQVKCIRQRDPQKRA